MKFTRRAALKSSTLAAAALALRAPRALLAAIHPGRRVHRHRSRRAHRDHLARDLLALHRAPRRSHLRRRLGRRRLEDPKHRRHPPGLHRHHEGHPGARPALARRLLRRLLQLARRHRPARTSAPPAPPSGASRRPTSTACTSSCTPAARSAASPTSPPTCAPSPRVDFYQEIEYCNAPAGDLPSNSAAPARPNALAARTRRQRRPRTLQRRPVGRRQRELGLRRQPHTGGIRRRVPPLHRMDARTTPASRRASSPSGPNGDDTDWTHRLFRALYANGERRHLWGLSVHYYTSGSPYEVRRRRCTRLLATTSTTTCSPAPPSWSASSPTTSRR